MRYYFYFPALKKKRIMTVISENVAVVWCSSELLLENKERQCWQNSSDSVQYSLSYSAISDCSPFLTTPASYLKDYEIAVWTLYHHLADLQLQQGKYFKFHLAGLISQVPSV